MGNASKCEVLLDGGGTWEPYEDVRIIHTPGHTPGSLCVMVQTAKDVVLFSGDHLAYSASRKGLEGFK
jgi:glyoxylase-like metal-dependent hydrolase (beta-lactamase superfamily II)